MLFADVPWWESPAFGNAVMVLVMAVASYLTWVVQRTKRVADETKKVCDDTKIAVADNTALCEPIANKVDKFDSATKAIDNKVNAAVVIAKQAKTTVTEAVETKAAQHEEVKVQLENIAHEVNGGFVDKVAKAMQPHAERLNALESKTGQLADDVSEILRIVKGKE